MKIKHLRQLSPDSKTWQWQTDNDTGIYLTFSNGKGILFQRHDGRWGCKVATFEKFSVCRTPSGTRKKLNRMFSTRPADPTPENEWRF